MICVYFVKQSWKFQSCKKLLFEKSTPLIVKWGTDTFPDITNFFARVKYRNQSLLSYHLPCKSCFGRVGFKPTRGFSFNFCWKLDQSKLHNKTYYGWVISDFAWLYIGSPGRTMELDGTARIISWSVLHPVTISNSNNQHSELPQLISKACWRFLINYKYVVELRITISNKFTMNGSCYDTVTYNTILLIKQQWLGWDTSIRFCLNKIHLISRPTDSWCV